VSPLALLLLLASAAPAAPTPPPACPAVAPLDREALSVAWVTRASHHVWPWTRITVTPTRELRERALATKADVPRLLQLVGARRSSREPRRPWIVVVFDVTDDDLCVPADPDRVAGDRFAGLPVCDRGDHGLGLLDDHCGRAIDRKTGKTSLPVWRIRWRDAAARGFCALPAERFVRGR
jgi:hypothetical protein